MEAGPAVAHKNKVNAVAHGMGLKRQVRVFLMLVVILCDIAVGFFAVHVEDDARLAVACTLCQIQESKL